MTFFFMYHPNSVAWLPAPVTMDGVKKKRRLTVKQRMKLRRKKQLEQVLALMEALEDG
jgi:hypothetical protein